MRKESKKITVAVAGQPNSGKSTIFNVLTGARQHVANYPGVTVEKKTGAYRFKGGKVDLVDLPGTYSLTSYTLEERIARDFVLHEKPAAVVDVVDASNLERNLYLAFQLMEMDIPLVVNLNMMDIARRRGLKIDPDKLSRQLKTPVVPTVGNRGKGKKELKETIWKAAKKAKVSPFRLDYGESLEPTLANLEGRLSKDPDISRLYSTRWLAVKLMEDDNEAQRLLKERSKRGDEILRLVEQERGKFISQQRKTPEKVIASQRYQAAERIVKDSVVREKVKSRALTDKIDMVLCNRFAGPIILLATIYAMYNLTIVQGYRITAYTWPIIAWCRNLLASILPSEGVVFDPFWRAMPIGIVDGIAAVLNYIPLFVLLFTFIAILEDTGYMARMAFILDRVFRYFGLHGQSVMPLVLGGVYVGGCAIPGVMACRGIKDEKARMATMMVVPLMNCLAKIPLYVLLIGLFFAAYKGLIMFFIATITIIIALGVAKILSLTVLKRKETAPFVLEMPAYHVPTIQGVLRRMLERLRIFFVKIVTVVIIVMAIIYVLMNFPGLSKERKAYYNGQANQVTQSFCKKIGEDNPYTKFLAGPKLMEFTGYWTDYKKADMGAKGKEAKDAVKQEFGQKNPNFFKVVNRGKGLDGKTDKHAEKVYGAYKKLYRERMLLRKSRKDETIRGSIMGRLGRSLEPVTRWAGFNWKANIALISAFAAKENSVATVGAIYQSPMGGEALEERIAKEERGWTPLHALAMILFMAMYPPCIPTLLMIRIETGSTKWMLFATFYPIILGAIIAFLAFTVGGNLLGLSGLQTMIVVYVLAIAFMMVAGLTKRGRRPKLVVERG